MTASVLFQHSLLLAFVGWRWWFATASDVCSNAIEGQVPVPELSLAIGKFSDQILVERKKSFWNTYYGEQCTWVADNLLATHHINATTAPMNVVEIGTAWGGNADYMGAHFAGANVYAVDPLAPDYDPTDQQSKKINSLVGHASLTANEAGQAWADALVLDAHRNGGPGCRYHLVRMFSNAASPVLLQALGHHSVHFLFIDGLHTYEGVVADIRNFLPLVKAGGVIIFNDYGGTFKGVTRAVEEFVAANPALTLTVGSLGKPPGITNAGISIPMGDWILNPKLPWPIVAAHP